MNALNPKEGERVFMKWRSLAIVMEPLAISEIVSDFSRSGRQLHRTVIVLGQGGEVVRNLDNSSKIRSVEEYFNLKQYGKIMKIYLPFAYRREIIDSEELYLITRAMLILKRRKDVLSLLKLNKDIIIHNRVLMFEYIVICAREGDFESMIEGIKNCETRFGNDAIHCKVLEALIHSNSNIEEYIGRMHSRYKKNASYEILRAAYTTKKEDLMRECLSGLGDDPRHKILGLRTTVFLGEGDKTDQILRTLSPDKFNKIQSRDIVRVLLQTQSKHSPKQWIAKAGMSPESVDLEIARYTLASGIMENNFKNGLKGLESLLKYDQPTATQVLRLIRIGHDYQFVFQQFLSIAGAHGYMLQLIAEFGIKYSFKDISLSALIRLESLMLCDVDGTKYQKNYLEGAKNSGDITMMQRAYDCLEFIQNPIDEVFEFASYFSTLHDEVDSVGPKTSYLDEEAIEPRVLRAIINRFTASKPQYVPVPNQSLVVNNSLKFGGAERQVVRCLENKNFLKSLAVWNTEVNTPENSFIEDVNNLGIEIFDYSKNNTRTSPVMMNKITHLLQLIPDSPPMNPGISQKIENLINLILKQKPTTLHLWQDTTNILGAIAGLLCGVPKIVMSARSLPPFNLPNSTFPNKGPNYYYNNRFVRMNYLDVLEDERVFLCHNSINGLEKYVEWLGGYDEKMLLLRNGFDLNKFKHQHVKKTDVKQFNIGVVFRFVDVKQPFLWLDTAKMVLETAGKHVHFTMVGDGPLLDESIQYAEKIGVSDFVDFKGYREDVVELLATFDLFLLTSLIEGLPNVLIEAQAMGVPVISTDAGGAKETFVHNKSGYLVKNGTAENLCDNIMKIISDKEFQENASSIAKQHVYENFSLEVMHSHLEKILFEGL